MKIQKKCYNAAVNNASKNANMILHFQVVTPPIWWEQPLGCITRIMHMPSYIKYCHDCYIHITLLMLDVYASHSCRLREKLRGKCQMTCDTWHCEKWNESVSLEGQVDHPKHQTYIYTRDFERNACGNIISPGSYLN